MATPITVLTPAETAVVADVSVRDVNRVIDEKILPEQFYGTASARTFTVDACALISFYFHAANRLTSDERVRTINAARHLTLSSGKHRTKWLIEDDFLTIDLLPFLKTTIDRLTRLEEARDLVTVDEDILGGTPVIKGTRIPVYDVAASVAADLPMRRILSAYPGLDEDKVALAALYAEASPQRGRPSRRSSPPANAVVIANRRVPRRNQPAR
jgi:uncharacterized protein (DUF433 family)